MDKNILNVKKLKDDERDWIYEDYIFIMLIYGMI
jgi:hypothetical protein